MKNPRLLLFTANSGSPRRTRGTRRKSFSTSSIKNQNEPNNRNEIVKL
jgi:hypothetical protein